jgi:hypothetical protein
MNNCVTNKLLKLFLFSLHKHEKKLIIFLKKECNYLEIKKNKTKKIKKRSSHPFFSFYNKCCEKNTHEGYCTPTSFSCYNHYYKKNTKGTLRPPLLLVATITTKLKHKRSIMPPLFLLMQQVL